MQPTVEIAQGRLVGSEQAGIRCFKGIPYASAPFGPHRFARPTSPPGWTGERQAVDYGPTAPKPPYPAAIGALLPEPVIPGEGYLNLNVWTPTAAVGLPVLVWVHGGAFVNGSGAVPHYDGTAFARDGVVCVTINYRLGFDGFGVVDGAPVNRGLLDQIAALHWVRANIAAFGGDPDRVTIAGESAGAMSVTTLLTMPDAAGLFRGVIAQSGAGHHALPPATAAKVTAALAAALGVPATVDGLGGVDVEALVAAQATLSAQIALDPNATANWGEIGLNLMAFEPVIDGAVLPELPIRSVQAGAGAEVAVLTGTNTDEHALFLVPTGVVDFVNELILQVTLGRLGADPSAALERYRARLPQATPGELLVAILTDWFFRVPAVRLAEARRAHSAATYVYEFGWRSPALGGRLGACHALEIPFAFDTLDGPGPDPLGGDDPPHALAAAMHGEWVAFVRDGAPSWPAYGDERVVRYFGDVVETRVDPDAARLQLWDGIR